MKNPLHMAPVDTPPSLVWACTVLALYILPALFAGICLFMRITRIPRAPYFAYFCAFGSLASLCLGIAGGNNPLTALALFLAFNVGILILICNLLYLHFLRESSAYHQGAIWCSRIAILVIMFFILWTFA